MIPILILSETELLTRPKKWEGKVSMPKIIMAKDIELVFNEITCRKSSGGGQSPFSEPLREGQFDMRSNIEWKPRLKKFVGYR